MKTFEDEYKKIVDKYLIENWAMREKNLKEKLMKRPIVLYGLGFFGAVIVRNFKQAGILVECFCDSKKRGIDEETSLPIISPEELVKEYSNANVVISVANPANEESVHTTVKSLGFNDDQIFYFRDAYQFMQQSRVERVGMCPLDFAEHIEGYQYAYNFFHDIESKNIILEIINSYFYHDLFTYDSPKNSYFPPQFTFHQHEVFIDGGLYTGDTTEEFIRRVNGTYKRIIGFDIDEVNLLQAHENLDSYSKVEIVPKGLWNCTKSMTAELGIKAGSNIKEGGKDTVELVSLDEFFQEKTAKDYPTFIKLDIEGSEKQALLGAKKIIQRSKPKLAVCVYHKPEDLYELLRLIKELNPDYNMFLKHYSPYIWDTVLYAY